jgi:acylphosphatase
MSKTRAHFFLSGKVQGVCFRAASREKARSLGIKGWVRNLADGRVEIVAEGEKGKVKKFVDWAEEGPDFAGVENVELYKENYKGEFDKFEIKY